MMYLIAFCLSFVSIFGRSFQQQNVIYRRRALVLPVSYFLAGSEMLTAAMFVENYLTSSPGTILLLIIAIGTGGGLACLLAMQFHEWLTKRIYKWGGEADVD